MTRLLVVDDHDTATAQRADLRLRWARERDLEALTSLHALQRGLALRARDLEGELGGLLERVGAVPHVAFVHGPGLSGGAGGQRRVLVLNELVRELSHDRHVVTLALPGAAGTRGAEDVLAWQTGYCGNVDLAGGHPELLTATRPPASREGLDMALRIEKAFGPKMDHLLRMQLAFDIARARRRERSIRVRRVSRTPDSD